MGCYSVACNFLKTPINEHDKCYMVFFKNPLNKEYETYKELFIRYSESYESMLKSLYVGHLYGTYNDYGWVREHEDKQDELLSEDILSYFISEEAIEFIKNYNDTEYDKYPNISITGQVNRSIDRVIKENEIYNSDYSNLLRQDKEFLTLISMLYQFNLSNGIQMFQLGFYESYYRQLESYEDFKIFNDLRTKIILDKEKKWNDERF